MLKIEDLKEGEIYYRDYFIFIHVKIDPYKCNNTAISIRNNRFYNANAAMDNYNKNPDRLATPEEKHWLNECIKADKFITYEEAIKTFKQKNYKYEVVHCRTQEEWDFVTSKINPIARSSYPDYDTINIDGSGWREFSYWKDKAKIYSFQEWCNKFNFNYENSWISEAKKKFKIGEKVIDLMNKEAIITEKWEILGNNLYNNGNLISQEV